jgi:hypothetical protein
VDQGSKQPQPSGHKPPNATPSDDARRCCRRWRASTTSLSSCEPVTQRGRPRAAHLWLPLLLGLRGHVRRACCARPDGGGPTIWVCREERTCTPAAQAPETSRFPQPSKLQLRCIYQAQASMPGGRLLMSRFAHMHCCRDAWLQVARNLFRPAAAVVHMITPSDTLGSKFASTRWSRCDC